MLAENTLHVQLPQTGLCEERIRARFVHDCLDYLCVPDGMQQLALLATRSNVSGCCAVKPSFAEGVLHDPGPAAKHLTAGHSAALTLL